MRNETTPIVGFRFARVMKASELAEITRRAAQEKPGAKGREVLDWFGKMAVMENIEKRRV